jgi:hypothetical protein
MTGPFSSSAVPDDGTRLKLGALWIPTVPGLDVTAEIDQENGELVSVSLILVNSIAAVQIFAAAKDHDTWTELRYEISARLEETKVVPKIINGKFGSEIHAVMPNFDDAGNVTVQEVRFLGINGDRWFMRVTVSGDGAEPGEAADKIDAVIADLVVDRGDAALAPGARLPIEFPSDEVISGENPENSIHIEI